MACTNLPYGMVIKRPITSARCAASSTPIVAVSRSASSNKPLAPLASSSTINGRVIAFAETAFDAEG
jgi:hypothetical protein